MGAYQTDLVNESLFGQYLQQIEEKFDVGIGWVTWYEEAGYHHRHADGRYSGDWRLITTLFTAEKLMSF